MTQRMNSSNTMNIKANKATYEEDQGKRNESSEIKPHINGQITFDKGAKKLQWSK